MIISTIDNKEAKKEKPFPKLMISEYEKIVLFISEKEGIVIKKSNFKYDDDVGHYSNSWILSGFKDFNGSITLTNGE